MPYNTTALPPNEEPQGAATLPLARVKKILAQDDDINSVAANSAFAITIATEMFIRYMAEKAFDVAKTNPKKSARVIGYDDLAEAVHRIDNLEFLQDLIPKTTTYGEYKAKRIATARQASTLPPGQTTLDGRRPQPQQVLETTTAPIQSQEQDKSNQAGPSNSKDNAEGAQNGQQFVFEHYQGPNGAVHRDEAGDVQME